MKGTVVCNNEFGKALADKLGYNFVEFQQRTFPDGEVCPRIMGDVRENVVLVNYMEIPLEPNRNFIEILLLIRNLMELGAKNIDVVMPYFIYSRQDKIFRGGEPFSAKFILDTIHKAGANRLFTISSHAQRDKDVLTISEMPTFNVNGFLSIGDYLKTKKFSNPIIVGPDKGADHFAKTTSDVLGCEYVLFEKKRDLHTGDVEMQSNIDLKGKEVIIVDDITSSGGTLLPAIELSKKNGAKSVSCYVVHLVSEKGIDKIKSHVEEFYASNSIGTPISKISVLEHLAEKLKE